MPSAGGLTYQPFIRAQWGGTLGDPAQDIWSNSVAFHGGGNPFEPGYLPTRAELVEAAPNVFAALASWMGRPQSFISAGATLRYVKLNAILENGKQRDMATVEFLGTRAGDTISQQHPWQASWALTLRSDTYTRGRGHSGRIYPPMVCAPMDAASPYTTFPAALLMAESFRDCLNGIAAAIGEAVDVPAAEVYHPVINSPGRVAAGQTGFAPNIDRVVCDRVPDVQRRRVNAVLRSEGAPAMIVVP